MAEPLPTEVIQIAFGLVLVVTGLIVYVNRTSDSGSPNPPQFFQFQTKYLACYLMAMLADWMQGPYVYALYESYGYSQADNAILFVFGFGSAAVFGSFIGSMADGHGRKKYAILYCVFYIASCATKHFPNFYILLLGRIVGGIATSLLFSVFESWMVCEHNARGFPPELIGATFSLAFFWNSVVAIAAGMVSQFAADLVPQAEMIPGVISYGGYSAPFDLSALTLVICAIGISALWTENYGKRDANGNTTGLVEATKTCLSNPQVLLCGIISSFFESSMYIFVFMWTPAVTPSETQKPPYGLIFATFMMSCMLGSRLFNYLASFTSMEIILQLSVTGAFLAHAVPVFTENTNYIFIAFLVFETCVGFYFPAMGTLKGKYVPEDGRASIYNVYRIPLNCIVVLALVSKMSMIMAFRCTTVLLLCAALLAQKLSSLTSKYSSPPNSPVELATDIERPQE